MECTKCECVQLAQCPAPSAHFLPLSDRRTMRSTSSSWARARAKIQVNYFVNAVSQRGKVVELDFDTTASMNDYAFEWLPDALRWFVNGRLIHEVKREADEPFPVTPGTIHLSVWNGKGMEGWLGRFVYPGRPLAVRYEHIAFTEAGQPCRFPASIICKRGPTSKPQ